MTTTVVGVQLSRGRLGVGAHLAAGLGLVGVAGYAFVAIVGRVFEGPEDAALVTALISVYLLINIIGPGVFAAVEQETSRAVSAAVTRGSATWPVAKRAGLLAAGAFAAVAAVVLIAWPLVLRTVLDGRLGLLAALLLAVAGSACVYWLRGVFGGQQRFAAYAATFYIEGGVRLLPCIGLFVLAVHEPSAYGLVFAAGSAVAALAMLAVLRAGPTGGGVEVMTGMGRSLALLVGATALSQLVANLAPVIVTYRLVDAPVAASVFGSTFVLARIPLFLFAPVLAVLLPLLTQAAVQNRPDLLSARLRRVVYGVLVVGGSGVALGAALGPAATEFLFNTPARPPAVTVALLAAATVLMMTALVLQPALLALGRQRAITLSWALGAFVFLGLLLLPIEPIAASTIAQLVGPFIVTALLAFNLRRALAAAPADSAANTTVV